MDVDNVVDLSITPVGSNAAEKDIDTLSRDIRTLTRNSSITITPSQPNVSSFGNDLMFVQLKLFHD